jgi:hypothetical protein
MALCALIANREAWPVLDAGAAETFIEAPDLGVIFVPGPPSPVTAAAALMLRALRRELIGLVRIGIAAPRAEALLRRRLVLHTLPGMGFVGAGQVLACLGPTEDWDDYLAATDKALGRLARLRHLPLVDTNPG